MIKKEDVLLLLQNVTDKDFATLLQAVDASTAKEEKARNEYKNANLSRITVQQYHDAELRWKVAHQKRLTDLTAFFDFFSGRSKTFNGRSFARRQKLSGRLVVKNGNLCIDFGVVAEGKESERVLQSGDVIEIELNNVWVAVKVEVMQTDKTQWRAVGLSGLVILGRQARV